MKIIPDIHRFYDFKSAADFTRVKSAIQQRFENVHKKQVGLQQKYRIGAVTGWYKQFHIFSIIFVELEPQDKLFGLIQNA